MGVYAVVFIEGYIMALNSIEANALDLKNGIKIYKIDGENNFILTSKKLNKYDFFMDFKIKIAFILSNKTYYKFKNENIRRI